MPAVPAFHFALVRHDDVFIEDFGLHVGLTDEALFVAKDDGACACEARAHPADYPLGFFRIVSEIRRHQGPRSHHAHISFDDIDELRQLVEFADAQDASDARYAPVVAQGDGSMAELFAVFDHGGELPDEEGLSAIACTLLQVEDLAALGDEEHQADEQEKGQAEQQERAGEEEVEESLGEVVLHRAKIVICGEL